MKHTTRKKALHFLWVFLMVCQSSLAQTSNKPSTYALVIGISDYKDDQITDLSYAHRDAEAFANYLYSKAGGSLKPDQVNLLTNEQATFGNITVGLDWLSDVAKEGDRIILYFAGHGDVETKTVARRGFLLSYDSPSSNYRSNSLGLDMLSDYCNTFTQLKKAKVILITDACHAGNLAGRQVKGSEITSTALIENFPNQVRILSCQPQEYSLEGRQWGEGRGVFSFYLINGLFGMADKNQDQSVTLLELQTYLQEQVPAQTAPQIQVPLAYGGNMQEKIGIVDPQILDALKKRREDQTLTFASIEHRGLESVILSGLDTSLVHIFKLYKQALVERRFFEPKGESAAHYYEQIKKASSETKVFPIIQRQFAATLMEAVQEEVNRSLRDQEETGQRGEITFLPRVQFAQQCVLKTMELVGSEHSMYKALMARKHHFEALKYFYQDVELNSSFLFKAIQEIEKAIDLDTLIADAYNTGGLLYRALNTTVLTSENTLGGASIKASKFYAKAAELAPNWAIPQLNLLFFWRNQRNFPKALEYAQRVMAIAPHRWFAPYHLAVETARKDPQNALPLYQQALNLSDSKPNVYYSMSLLHSRLKDTLAQKSAYDSFIRAIQTYLQKKPTSFISYCEVLVKDILEKNPKADLIKTLTEQLPQIKPIDVYYGLGVYYHFGQGRDFHKAEMYFQKVLEINPNHLWVNYKLGQLYQFRLSNPGKAKQYFFKVLAIDSTHIYVRTNLSQVYIQENNLDSALIIAQNAIRIRPDFAQGYNQLAYVYQIKKDYPKVEEFRLKAYLINERDPNYLSIVIDFYMYTQAQLNKTLPYIDKLFALDSTLLIAHEYRLASYRFQQKYDQVRSGIEKMKPLIAEHDYFLRLGWYYLEQDNQDSIKWALQKAAASKGNINWNNKYRIGMLYWRVGMPAESEKIFKEMWAVTPYERGVFWGLAIGYDQSKRYKELEQLALQFIPQIKDKEELVDGYCALLLAQSRLGHLDEYKKTLDILHETAKNIDTTWWGDYYIACTIAKWNQMPEALRYLDQAFAKGMPAKYLLDDIELMTFNPLPEYKALLRKHYPGLFE